MTAADASEAVSDYSGFEFARLWEGREKVSEVERAIVARALAPGDWRRILDIGTGFGRLLGTLATLSREVVATDLDVRSLGSIALPSETVQVKRVAANLYHLPFVDGAFTGATMVRVHHHLLDPTSAFREIARVLWGHSPFVVSYRPTPSLSTFVDDVQRALRPRRDAPYRSVTFARRSVVLPPQPFPIRATGRREFLREVRAAGFRWEREVGSGYEEYSPLHRIPADRFVRIGTTFGRAPAFPQRFAVLVKQRTSERPFPELSAILACPRCGVPQPSWSEGETLECGRCSFAGGRNGSVLDLRYVPRDVGRWGVSG